MEILLRLEGKFDFKDLASCCLLVPFYFPTLCSFFFLSDLSSLASSPLPFLVFLSLECLHQNYLTLSKYGWNQNFWSQGPRVCIFTSSPADSFVPEEIKSHWPKPTTTATATAQSFPPPPSPRKCSKSVLLHILPLLHIPIFSFTISNTRLMQAHCVDSSFQSTLNNGLSK